MRRVGRVFTYKKDNSTNGIRLQRNLNKHREMRDRLEQGVSMSVNCHCERGLEKNGSVSEGKRMVNSNGCYSLFVDENKR